MGYEDPAELLERTSARRSQYLGDIKNVLTALNEEIDKREHVVEAFAILCRALGV